MKRAVILHGTDGKPESNWFPWLKNKLEEQGYEVWAPLLPGNHAPNRQTYNDFLLGESWDFTDNIVIGHSSGAVSVLNLLMDNRCPKIKLGVMVSAWTGGIPRGYEPDTTQFDNLFPAAGFNFSLIKSKADKLAFLHSRDDPYCPLEQAEFLADSLDAPLTVMEHAGHIGKNFIKLPEIWEIIKPALEEA